MSDRAAPPPWRLINFKAAPDVIERIDAAAHAAGMSRTAYILALVDPQAQSKPVVNPKPDDKIGPGSIIEKRFVRQFGGDLWVAAEVRQLGNHGHTFIVRCLRGEFPGGYDTCWLDMRDRGNAWR